MCDREREALPRSARGLEGALVKESAFMCALKRGRPRRRGRRGGEGEEGWGGVNGCAIASSQETSKKNTHIVPSTHTQSVTHTVP